MQTSNIGKCSDHVSVHLARAIWTDGKWCCWFSSENSWWWEKTSPSAWLTNECCHGGSLTMDKPHNVPQVQTQLGWTARHEHRFQPPARCPALLSLPHEARNFQMFPDPSGQNFFLLNHLQKQPHQRSCLSTQLLEGIPKPGLHSLQCMTGPLGGHRCLIFHIKNPRMKSCIGSRLVC